MTLKPNQRKAIQWYCEENGLIPQMSVIPTDMAFKVRETGKLISVHLNSICLRYEKHRESSKKVSA